MSEFIDTVHPELRPIVKDFLLKCKYPFELSFFGGYVHVDDIDYRLGVLFIDPNVPNTSTMHGGANIAGRIKLVESKAGKNKFRIVTRSMQNTKFKEAERRRSVETVSARNALKAMLTHTTPISITEVAESREGVADMAIRGWKEEFSNEIYRAFKTLQSPTIVEEVRHLQALGVEFKTPEFRRIAEESAGAFEETKRRQNVCFMKHFVMLKKDGSISIAGADGKTNIFDRFESLPSFIQEAVGMLKLMDVNIPIPEIGVGAGENMFWIFQKVER
jgi:hypothetical protein